MFLPCNTPSLLRGRSLRVTPSHLWQMDATHIPELGSWWWDHFSVDASSGFIFASAHIAEAAKYVIAHCLVAFVPQAAHGHLTLTMTQFIQRCLPNIL